MLHFVILLWKYSQIVITLKCSKRDPLTNTVGQGWIQILTSKTIGKMSFKNYSATKCDAIIQSSSDCVILSCSKRDPRTHSGIQGEIQSSTLK